MLGFSGASASWQLACQLFSRFLELFELAQAQKS
jgi:hypothetical protein